MPRKKSTMPTDTAIPLTARKTDQMISLLRREQGATMEELAEATQWLAHTIRAALTGLRKKGHAIERRKRGTITCYHIVDKS